MTSYFYRRDVHTDNKYDFPHRYSTWEQFALQTKDVKRQTSWEVQLKILGVSDEAGVAERGPAHYLNILPGWL